MKEKTKETMSKLLDEMDTACDDIRSIYNAVNKLTIRLYEDEEPMGLMRLGYELSDLYFMCGEAVDRAIALSEEIETIRDAMEGD